MTATGDLTLRGTTSRVTIPLTPKRSGGRIEVLGNLPIVFQEWGIPNPSFGPAQTEDRGELALLLQFERGA
ncbi:MAG: YceI family protein [Actinomycetota bacterium]|nr:YceI family protein [Actinomycetota bacterium]